jgi:hypothetical protein
VGTREGPAEYDAEQHQTAAAAFAEIDRLTAQMARTGAPVDAIELVVVDVERATLIGRLGTH